MSTKDSESIKPVTAATSENAAGGVKRIDWTSGGYWISPDGTAFPVLTHIDAVAMVPQAFGYSREHVVAVFEKYREPYGTEGPNRTGKARAEIIESLVDRGWIRIRLFKRSGFSVQLAHDTPSNCALVTQFFIGLRIRTAVHPGFMKPFSTVRISSQGGTQVLTVLQVLEGIPSREVTDSPPNKVLVRFVAGAWCAIPSV